MDLRTATVGPDKDRFTEYTTSDGRIYFYDTWFNSVVWSKDDAKDNAKDDAKVSAGKEIIRGEKETGAETKLSREGKANSATAPTQVFADLQPEKAGSFGSAWYRDPDTGHVIFKQPPPPPNPTEGEEYGQQPITEESVYSQLVDMRCCLNAWRSNLSWLCGPGTEKKSTRYCVDHHTDAGGWILMARAHDMDVNSGFNGGGLNKREKGFLSCNMAAPAGPFGSRQAEGSLRDLARTLGMDEENPEIILSALRDVRIFACSSLKMSDVIHVKLSSKKLLSKCVLEGPMSIAREALDHCSKVKEWLALRHQTCEALTNDTSLRNKNKSIRIGCSRIHRKAMGACGMSKRRKDRIQFALVWVRLHPGVVYSGLSEGYDPSFPSISSFRTHDLSTGWHARLSGKEVDTKEEDNSEDNNDRYAIKLARAESSDGWTAKQMSKPEDVPKHLQHLIGNGKSFEPCFLCNGTGERWVAAANTYGKDFGELTRQESRSRSMEIEIEKENGTSIEGKSLHHSEGALVMETTKISTMENFDGIVMECEDSKESNGSHSRSTRKGNMLPMKRRDMHANGKGFSMTIPWRKSNKVLPLQQDRCWMCRGSGSASQSILLSIDGSATDDSFSVQASPQEDDLCPICWSNPPEFGMATTCTHLFCKECILMHLKSSKQSGEFPAFCPMCKDACPSNEVPRYGRITGKALGFLRKMEIIDLEFQVQFMRLQNGEQRQYFKCPSPVCNNILVDQDPIKVLRNGREAVRSVERCPCGVGVCLLCHAMVNDDDKDTHHKVCPMQVSKRKSKKGGDFNADVETKQMMKKLGKKCPNCSMFILKNEGCDIMFCGDKAHGDLKRAIKNGGCGQSFKWSTGEKISTNIIGPNGARVFCNAPVKFATEIALLKKQYGILYTDKEEELIRKSKHKVVEDFAVGRYRRPIFSTSNETIECARGGALIRLMRLVDETRVQHDGTIHVSGSLDGDKVWGIPCCPIRFADMYFFLSWFPHFPTPFYLAAVLFSSVMDPILNVARGVVYLLKSYTTKSSKVVQGHPFDVTIFLVQLRTVLVLCVTIFCIELIATHAGYFRFFVIPILVGSYHLFIFSTSRTHYRACTKPLEIACMRGHADIVRVLLRQGASRTATASESGLSPLRYCTLYGRWDAANALYEYDEQMPVHLLDTGQTQGTNDSSFSASWWSVYSPMFEAAVCCCRWEAACCAKLRGDRGGGCGNCEREKVATFKRLHCKSFYNLFRMFCLLAAIGSLAYVSEYHTCMPVYLGNNMSDTAMACAYFDNSDESQGSGGRLPLGKTWEGKCNRFLTCGIAKLEDVQKCDSPKPGCSCVRKVCRDRIYFDTRDAKIRSKWVSSVRDARFDLQIVLPTLNEVKQEMDVSGVRGITLFDAPPALENTSPDQSVNGYGTWLGLLRAKGRSEYFQGTTVKESSNPNLITFRMRSGFVGPRRDSFRTHPPVVPGGGDCFFPGQQTAACLDVDVGMHHEIFDGNLHNVTWTIQVSQSLPVRISIYIDGILMNSSSSRVHEVSRWSSENTATLGYSSTLNMEDDAQSLWGMEGWWAWWPSIDDKVSPSFGNDVLMPNIAALHKCESNACEPLNSKTTGTDAIEVTTFSVRDYRGNCQSIVTPTNGAPFGCPASHLQNRHGTLVYTWIPHLVESSHNKTRFDQTLPPLIGGRRSSSIKINDCSYQRLAEDPYSEWKRETVFLNLKPGDSLVGERGIFPSSAEIRSLNLSENDFDAALWQWRDFPRCETADLGEKCDDSLRCQNVHA